MAKESLSESATKEQQILAIHKELGITDYEKTVMWKQIFNPSSADAVENLGARTAAALETFTGWHDASAKQLDRALSQDDLTRSTYFVGQEALRRLQPKIEEIKRTIDETGDSVERHAANVASDGHLAEVEALLEGREPSDVTRTIRTIALVSRFQRKRGFRPSRFNLTKNGFLYSSSDEMSAAGVHCARMLSRDLPADIPEILKKALK